MQRAKEIQLIQESIALITNVLGIVARENWCDNMILSRKESNKRERKIKREEYCQNRTRDTTKTRTPARHALSGIQWLTEVCVCLLLLRATVHQLGAVSISKVSSVLLSLSLRCLSLSLFLFSPDLLFLPHNWSHSPLYNLDTTHPARVCHLHSFDSNPTGQCHLRVIARRQQRYNNNAVLENMREDTIFSNY